MRKAGFTLIELLVVIAIIAILAAILFPVFARAREKARQTSCLSNIKQISLGYMMYASDYDSWFPGFLTGHTSPNNRVSWHDVISPYLKNTQVYYCVSSGFYLAPNRYSTSTTSTNPDGYGTDYYGFKSSMIPNPAEKLLIGDCAGDNSTHTSFGSKSCMVYSEYIAGDSNTFNTCRGHIWPCHNDMANMGFCDGHAKAIQPRGYYGTTSALRNKYWYGAAE